MILQRGLTFEGEAAKKSASLDSFFMKCFFCYPFWRIGTKTPSSIGALERLFQKDSLQRSLAFGHLFLCLLVFGRNFLSEFVLFEQPLQGESWEKNSF
ncbi:hypothetical protein AT245_01400 [Bartonella henselae]|nr:hypothetical protein AT244_07875 [Bartonella henselae]OLL44230.1 hypothetical protein AT245_01400 [Bartonella henselae]